MASGGSESTESNEKEVKNKEREVAAAIPVINDGQMTNLIFVKSKKGKWIFPKGGVKKEEISPHAARREAFEESGAIGDVELEPILVERNIKFYILNVQSISESYTEKDVRERKVMSAEEALANDEVANYVKEVVKKVIKYRLIDMEEFDLEDLL